MLLAGPKSCTGGASRVLSCHPKSGVRPAAVHRHPAQAPRREDPRRHLQRWKIDRTRSVHCGAVLPGHDGQARRPEHFILGAELRCSARQLHARARPGARGGRWSWRSWEWQWQQPKQREQSQDTPLFGRSRLYAPDALEGGEVLYPLRAGLYQQCLCCRLNGSVLRPYYALWANRNGSRIQTKTDFQKGLRDRGGVRHRNRF
mmetsp:Transcript_22492/g.49294  ORF Transcript_22492/g.49294 Transcript_22492/m.49294 type:complete len:203 (-) Transcript_22492:144-752(-)